MENKAKRGKNKRLCQWLVVVVIACVVILGFSSCDSEIDYPITIINGLDEPVQVALRENLAEPPSSVTIAIGGKYTFKNLDYKKYYLYVRSESNGNEWMYDRFSSAETYTIEEWTGTVYTITWYE
jgi:hypothetical protein